MCSVYCTASCSKEVLNCMTLYSFLIKNVCFDIFLLFKFSVLFVYKSTWLEISEREASNYLIVQLLAFKRAH